MSTLRRIAYTIFGTFLMFALQPILGNVETNTTQFFRTFVAVAQVGPNLSIPSAIPATPGDTVTVPVNYTANGNAIAIASTVFSVDFDENCLIFDPTDGGDPDTIPDAVSFYLPGDFSGSMTVNLNDTDGELDFSIADIVPPLAALPDSTIVFIEFAVSNAPACAGANAVVGFSDDAAASFGDTAGASVPGTTTDGSVAIPNQPYHRNCIHHCWGNKGKHHGEYRSHYRKYHRPGGDLRNHR